MSHDGRSADQVRQEVHDLQTALIIIVQSQERVMRIAVNEQIQPPEGIMTRLEGCADVLHDLIASKQELVMALEEGLDDE